MGGKLVPGNTMASKKNNTDNKKDNDKPDYSPYFQHQLNINENELSTASRFIKDRTDMNSDIMKLVPEINQARNIVLSSIVSPNDFSKKELIPSFDNSELGFSESFVSKTKKIIDIAVARYGFLETSYEEADECLFKSGADIEIIMPRSMVEDVIKDSIVSIDKGSASSKTDLESIDISDIKIEDAGLVAIDTNQKVKITKKIESLDVESKDIKEGISLSDFGIEYTGNPLYLSVSKRKDELVDEVLDNTYYGLGVDKEDIDPATLSVYDAYKRSVTKTTLTIGDKDVKPSKKELPFKMKVKSSAVMPIFLETVDNHLGYIVLTDEAFRSINTIPKESDLVNSLSSYNRTNSKSNVLSSIIGKASSETNIIKSAPNILANMLEVAENILLQTVQKSVSDSTYKSKIELNEENSLVRIMLYRALNNMKTRMMFIPKQYVSYIAFDYRSNGTGKTLLEDVTFLASFKAMLTLSEIYAAINKNIPVTEIKAIIDDNDPEPLKTKEMMEQDIFTSGNRRMIWGETSMEKHINWISNSRFRVTWVHKTFPENDVIVDHKNKATDYTVDTETGDRVMKSILKSMGLVPSALEDSENVEFASIEMLKNALFNKVTNERQEALSYGKSDRLRKYILSDSVMLELIYDLIDAEERGIVTNINSSITDETKKIQKIDAGVKLQILKDVVGAMGIRLPKAENQNDIDNVSQRFKEYKESIDDMLEALKESTYIKDVVSTIGIDDTSLINNIRLHLLMEWCENHNYAKELVSFINTKNNKDIKSYIDYINTKDENIIKLAKAIAKNKDKILSKLNEEANKTDDTEGNGMSELDTPPDDSSKEGESEMSDLLDGDGKEESNLEE